MNYDNTHVYAIYMCVFIVYIHIRQRTINAIDLWLNYDKL